MDNTYNVAFAVSTSSEKLVSRNNSALIYTRKCLTHGGEYNNNRKPSPAFTCLQLTLPHFLSPLQCFTIAEHNIELLSEMLCIQENFFFPPFTPPKAPPRVRTTTTTSRQHIPRYNNHHLIPTPKHTPSGPTHRRARAQFHFPTLAHIDNAVIYTHKTAHMELLNRRRQTPGRTIPASLIITGKDLNRFLRCRRQQQTAVVSPAELHCLPSATEYADFVSWSKNTCTAQSIDEIVFSAGLRFEEPVAHVNPYGERNGVKAGANFVARECGHALHPGTPTPDAKRCPTCIVDTHIQWMHVLTKALSESGGMTLSREKPESRHEQVFQAWYCGKLEFVQEIYRLEEAVRQEAEWERQNPYVRVGEVKSANEAVKKYWRELQAEDKVFEVKFEKEKSVRFDENTSFKAGRCQAYFCRKSPRYEAGRYRYEIAEEDVEDSSEDSLDMGDSDTEFDEISDDGFGQSKGSEDGEESISDDEECDDFEIEEVEGAEFIVFGD